MSASKESRFHPQNPNWYEDLVLRSSSYEDKHFTGACFNEDVSVVDESYLEISRESSFMRGSGVLLAVILIFIFSGNVVPAIFRPGFAFFKPAPFEAAFGVCILIGGAIAALKLLYLDVRLPRDIQVRFNRKTQKIYAYDYVKPKY